jgi:hypothetical protein
MYVTFFRTPTFNVTVDGKSDTITASSAEDALGLYFDHHIVVKDPFAASLEALRSMITIEHFNARDGRERIAMVNVEWPSGEVATFREEYLEDQLTEYLDAHADSTNALAFETWKSTRRPRAIPQTTWVGEAIYPDGTTSLLSEDSADTHWGAPLTEIALQLTELGKEGWSVVQLSEDKAIHDGMSGASEVRPSRIRYLLARWIP